jgi:hypothetical protein
MELHRIDDPRTDVIFYASLVYKRTAHEDEILLMSSHNNPDYQERIVKKEV